MEITSHKQSLLRTGGGPEVPKLLDNPAIDQFANIALEIPDVIDSDTIAAGSIKCKVGPDGQLEFNLDYLQSSDDNLSGN